MHTVGQGDLRQKSFKHVRIRQGAQTLIIDAHSPGLLHHLLEAIDQAHPHPTLGQQMGEQQSRGASAHDDHRPVSRVWGLCARHAMGKERRGQRA